MGYSARYHAASLVAVFLALAVGILIGAGLGDNLVSDTEANLRDSLEGDIEDARGEADELQVALDRERAFSTRAYPALVGDLNTNATSTDSAPESRARSAPRSRSGTWSIVTEKGDIARPTSIT